MSSTIASDRPIAGEPVSPVDPPGSGAPYGTALLAGAAVFALYAITLGPTTAFWDTSEYIATAHILGIPHPPGNPLFVIMARAWELLLAPLGLSVAVRVNLFSALMSSGAAVFWYLCVHRILSSFTDDERVRKIGAGASVLLAATAFTVWNQSNVNEKVYTISLFTIALLSWLAFMWRDRVDEHRGFAIKASWHDDNLILLAFFILALSVGNHLMAFLAAPALLILVLMVRPAALANWQLYAWGVLFAIIGLSVHLYLPIRAGLGPIINEADPTCSTLGGAFVSVITFGASGCEELSAALAREQYAKPPVTERMAPFWAQMVNYFQYFDWQWSRSLTGSYAWLAPARAPISLMIAAVGGYGAWRHWQKDRISFVYIATLFLTLSVGLVFYMNFKYGYTQAGVYGLPFGEGEVRERDYFYIVSFSLWGLWTGIGLTAMWIESARRFGEHSRGLLKGSPVMLVAILPLILNWSYASRIGDYSARDFAYNMLNSVEPYGILVTNGDNDTFPLWYLQEVEGVRRDVTVVVWSYLNTPWYVKQVRDLATPCEQPGAAAEDETLIRCQRVFDPETGASIYDSADYPTRGILPLSDAEIDNVTSLGYTQLPQNVIFEAGDIQVPLASGTVLPAADQFVLAMVRNAWGDRPVYFAMTTNTHRNLGFDPYVSRQGLAFRLVTPAIAEAEGLHPMPQDPTWGSIFGAYMDVPATRTLLWEDFVYRDMPDGMDHWVDVATRQIPSYYGYAHIALSQAEQDLGNEEAVEENLERADRWLDLAER